MTQKKSLNIIPVVVETAGCDPEMPTEEPPLIEVAPELKVTPPVVITDAPPPATVVPTGLAAAASEDLSTADPAVVTLEVALPPDDGSPPPEVVPDKVPPDAISPDAAAPGAPPDSSLLPDGPLWLLTSDGLLFVQFKNG